MNNLYYIIISFSVLFSAVDKISIDNCVDFSVKTDREIYFSEENLFLELDVKVENGFHIYSVDPSKSLASSYVEILDTTLFSIIGIMHEPEAQTKFDSTFNMDVYYHKNNIKVIQDLKLSDKIHEGEYIVNSIFHYYACNPTFCVPKSDPFSFSFNVSKGSARKEYYKTLDTDYESPIIKENELVQMELDKEINKGLFSFILFSIAMGFLALLTPCVFPMIPITVSYFTKEGEKENNKPILSAFIYAFGIVIIFTLLGLLLAFTMGASGAGDLAANQWVNLFIGFLFVFFAFNLFGFYEIEIPSIIRQYSLKQESKGGKLGIIFMSLTFTLTSFTCTVAFVGALLAAASTGSYFWPIIGMLSFSTAFAFPFFFLALFPQYLSKLPKSGGWLNSVKVVMGFLELAAAFKFISNADLVWKWGIFTRDSVLFIWSLIFLLMGLYIFGLIKMPFDAVVKKYSFRRIMLGLIVLFFSTYLGSGIFGYKVHGLVESYLPPNEGDWIQDLDQAYLLAEEENKPIFIDFTGYTCTNCRWMEINIFELDEVKLLFEDFILVQLYTDGKGEKYSINRNLEIDRFGTAALPYYVVLTPSDRLISTFPGMDPNSDNFIQFLTNAKSKFYK